MPEPWDFQTLLCLGIVICIWVKESRDGGRGPGPDSNVTEMENSLPQVTDLLLTVLKPFNLSHLGSFALALPPTQSVPAPEGQPTHIQHKDTPTPSPSPQRPSPTPFLVTIPPMENE